MGAGALTKDVEPVGAERQRWLALAEKALAGASFEEKLVSHTDDAIRIEPLYDRATGAEPLVRTNPRSPWIVSQRVDARRPERSDRGCTCLLVEQSTNLLVSQRLGRHHHCISIRAEPLGAGATGRSITGPRGIQPRGRRWVMTLASSAAGWKVEVCLTTITG